MTKEVLSIIKECLVDKLSQGHMSKKRIVEYSEALTRVNDELSKKK